MKLFKLVLIGALLLVGCGSGGGATGDENDPEAAGGTDEEQMQGETGDAGEPEAHE